MPCYSQTEFLLLIEMLIIPSFRGNLPLRFTSYSALERNISPRCVASTVLDTHCNLGEIS